MLTKLSANDSGRVTALLITQLDHCWCATFLIDHCIEQDSIGVCVAFQGLDGDTNIADGNVLSAFSFILLFD